MAREDTRVRPGTAESEKEVRRVVFVGGRGAVVGQGHYHGTMNTANFIFK